MGVDPAVTVGVEELGTRANSEGDVANLGELGTRTTKPATDEPGGRTMGRG
ncbi:hypothetical protein [Azospirillum brasilense]|uniref:hypothetical protein n=1 Tax=Azospirillum brasilense TaxID=192 RepID=UPI00157A9056|nr:hypothetical protein [Azospirillum brasilense]